MAHSVIWAGGWSPGQASQEPVLGRNGPDSGSGEPAWKLVKVGGFPWDRPTTLGVGWGGKHLSYVGHQVLTVQSRGRQAHERGSATPPGQAAGQTWRRQTQPRGRLVSKLCSERRCHPVSPYKSTQGRRGRVVVGAASLPSMPLTESHGAWDTCSEPKVGWLRPGDLHSNQRLR